MKRHHKLSENVSHKLRKGFAIHITRKGPEPSVHINNFFKSKRCN